MPLLLLDRDGVINENRPDYVTRWEEFRFLPRAVEALAAMRARGLRVAIVTNQSAVGRGLMTAEALDAIHTRMLSALESERITIQGIFACLHAPWHRCDCRKPRPGLLLRAIAALGEPPERCVAIGDGYEDLLAAHAAGVPCILVRTGRGEETLARLDGLRPMLIAGDLWRASEALARLDLGSLENAA